MYIEWIDYLAECERIADTVGESVDEATMYFYYQQDMLPRTAVIYALPEYADEL